MEEWVLLYLHATWYRTGPIMAHGVTEMGNRLTGGLVTDRPSGANICFGLKWPVREEGIFSWK